MPPNPTPQEQTEQAIQAVIADENLDNEEKAAVIATEYMGSPHGVLLVNQEVELQEVPEASGQQQ
jgi:hypothetical protein